jgi:ABC-type sugar transport system substrate-binding protein
VIDRRAFLATISAGIVAAPLAAEAQQAGKMFRIGFLAGAFSEILPQVLRELGYVEGVNLTIERRDAEGKPERYGDLAAELVRLKVDVIVAANPAATFAAKKATASIPIVMVNTPDPVQLGLVVSLGRPGGNITGTTSLSADLSIKQLELLKEAVPRAVRIAILRNPTNPWHPLALKGAEAAARSLAVQLQILEAAGPADLDNAFAAMTTKQAGAVLVLPDPMTARFIASSVVTTTTVSTSTASPGARSNSSSARAIGSPSNPRHERPNDLTGHFLSSDRVGGSQSLRRRTSAAWLAHRWRGASRRRTDPVAR